MGGYWGVRALRSRALARAAERGRERHLAAERIALMDSTRRSEAIEQFGETRWIKVMGGTQNFETYPDLGHYPGHKPVGVAGAKVYQVTLNGRLAWFVRVLNSTPEPDGKHKPYWLRVPNPMTPIAAIAYTFGFAAHGYTPNQET